MTTRKLTCSNCGTAIPAANISVQTMVAVCLHCDAVFDFAASDAKAKRRKLKPPRSLTIIADEPDHLHISRRWWHSMDRLDRLSFWVTSFFGVLFLLVAFYFLISIRTDILPDAVGVSPTLVAVFGAVFVYIALSYSLNTTHITVDEDEIKSQHKPLPRLGRGVVDRNAVRAIKLVDSRNHRGNTGNQAYFNLYAVTDDGKEKLLLYDAPRDQAEYIAHRLEAYIDAPSEPFEDFIDDETDAAEVDEVLYTEEEQARRIRR